MTALEIGLLFGASVTGGAWLSSALDIPMTALEIGLLFGASVTGGAWLSSARVVRCWVKSRNERNPYG